VLKFQVDRAGFHGEEARASKKCEGKWKKKKKRKKGERIEHLQ